MRNPALALLAAIAVTAPAPLHARHAGSGPQAVQASTEISLGETVSGRLDGSDPALGDGTHYDLFTYRGRRGERIEVVMRSADFDTYLAVLQEVDGELVGLASDDDGAGGTDSRVLLELPNDGVYVIRANALSEGGLGAYTLSLEPTDVTVASPEQVLRSAAANRLLQAGEQAGGFLDSGSALLDDQSPFEAWRFEARAGEPVDFEMRSADFDAYLHIGRVGDTDFLDSDDDGAGGTDALLSFVPEEDGTYVLVANAFDAGASGAYTLTAQRGRARTAMDDVFARISGAPRLRKGETASGTLDATRLLLEDRSYAVLYAYEGRAGERISITLRSNDFDAFLGVGSGSDDWIDDDDSAGGTDSRVTIEIPADGLYGILVNSLSAGEEGAYSLEVRDAGSDPETMTVEAAFSHRALATARPIRLGEAVSSSLDEGSQVLRDGSRFEVWRYSGRAGETVRVTMESEYMDTYLHVGFPDAPDTRETNDDGPDRTNSELTFELDRDGELIILANSLGAGETGPYTIRLERS